MCGRHGWFQLAEQVASQMISAAGVGIDWRQGLSGCPVEAIRITLSALSDHAPADLPANAMAYALPYEGNHIVIFYDRLQRKVKGTQIASLLAHVLAHEVTHILQGIHRHSDRGLMKATRSEEHTSELQSQFHLVCRLLLEKKNKNTST